MPRIADKQVILTVIWGLMGILILFVGGISTFLRFVPQATTLTESAAGSSSVGKYITEGYTENSSSGVSPDASSSPSNHDSESNNQPLPEPEVAGLSTDYQEEPSSSPPPVNPAPDTMKPLEPISLPVPIEPDPDPVACPPCKPIDWDRRDILGNTAQMIICPLSEHIYLCAVR